MSAMGAMLQQRVKDTWQPLAFFRKLNPAQQKYSVYDHELLAIYEAVKHFCHILEVHHFIIITDHKPITYAFQQKRDRCSLQQFSHLDFVTQFTTDVRHISRQDNVVADALSRVKSITVPPSYDALATSQDSDDELRTLLVSTTAPLFEKLPIPGTMVSICYDTCAGRSRPYVPAPLRLQVFWSIHDLSHPGTKATAMLAHLRPVPAARHASPVTFVHSDLEKCMHVFLHQDTTRWALESPYSSPYQVLSRTEKTLQLLMRGRPVTVSTNRVKPAYIVNGTDCGNNSCNPPVDATPL
jgi:hypothetical protein